MNVWLFAALALMGFAGVLVLLQWDSEKHRRWLVYGVMAVMPFLAGAMYTRMYPTGQEDTRSQAMQPAQADPHAGMHAEGAHDMGAVLETLQARLQDKPDDAETWFILGQTHLAMGRVDEADKALAEAVRLKPKDARLIAHHAEILAIREGAIDGRALEMVSAALDIDYSEAKALELAGLAAFQRGEWAQTLHFWRRLLKVLPPESAFYQDIAQGIQIVEERAVLASGLGDRARLIPKEKHRNPH
jgi:cytochrome c-type biogenesis protein CcmH